MHTPTSRVAPNHRFRGVALLVLLVGTIAGCGCQPAAGKPRVLVVGDSLVVESQDAIRARIPGAKILARTGAAPCSMIEEAVSASRSADVVVLAFSGNNSFLAPCMKGSDHRIGTAYRDSYQSYASRIGRSKLRMALTPVWGDRNAANSLTAREVAKGWATTRGVPIRDAASGLGGDRFLAGDWRMDGERGAGAGPFVSLRASDRVHLCVAPGYRVDFVGPACPKDSSAGVNRFAAGIAQAGRS